MTAVEFDDAEDRPVDFVFLILAAVFLASLVVCNLIANKFLTVDLGFKVFVLSAGRSSASSNSTAVMPTPSAGSR